MQRQIKFRAWDKKSKSFKNDEFFISTQSNNSIMVCGISTRQDASLINDEVRLSQFTGLKDKNGKEIYEGDIIQPTRGLDERKGYVKFLNGCFVLQFKDEYYSLNWYEGERGEVIGNIHENPELLNP